MNRFLVKENGITLIVLTLIIVGSLVVTGTTAGSIVYIRQNNIKKNEIKNENWNNSDISTEEEFNRIIDDSDEKKSETNDSTNDQSDSPKRIDDVGSITSNLAKDNVSNSGSINGYKIMGTIEIPATKVKYPILEKVTKSSIESAVAILYGPGPNKEGNTVIVGHNYRNGQFFSNNKKLANGDKVYITDTDGNKVSYTIYNKFETTPEDITFYTRNTNGAREVTLSTCTDDSKRRIIIFAKADDDA